MRMIPKIILQVLISLSMVSSCPVTHEQVWTCIVSDQCIDSISLHRQTQAKSSTKSFALRRPYILAVEGGHYHRLFSDCDTNKDGCIDMEDIRQSETCERPCMWRQTMYDLTC